ncbi:hypothetical protein [Mycoplasma phocimorsus]|nr:hypothetical protein [Mycoplasma phocimorsus]MDJ1647500.1 hypothetical protein [Mycoplasma phocimorsus]MDJ1647961.1 hypothetical protein [Mycoplasma phocimorsus]
MNVSLSAKIIDNYLARLYGKNGRALNIANVILNIYIRKIIRKKVILLEK